MERLVPPFFFLPVVCLFLAVVTQNVVASYPTSQPSSQPSLEPSGQPTKIPSWVAKKHVGFVLFVLAYTDSHSINYSLASTYSFLELAWIKYNRTLSLPLWVVGVLLLILWLS